jgi:ABC-2 type transport system ATP-binding protein
MSQRLGIAAAILGKPKYLLLDEPANGLDPEGIAWLRQFLKDYADGGNGVFVSSHLLSEMSQMADNVVVIGKGKLIASTSMKEIISGSSKNGVFVRVNNLSKFEKLLNHKLLSHARENGGIRISNATTDDIGKLAFGAELTVLELSNQGASLEEAFLELTAESQEYSGHAEGKR